MSPAYRPSILDRKADIVADLLGEDPAEVRDAWHAMADAEREQDRRWAAQAWARLEDDDETRDHYRAKWEQDQ